MAEERKLHFKKFSELLQNATWLENIQRGKCDFCYNSATQGRSNGQDAFYICKTHKNTLDKHKGV